MKLIIFSWLLFDVLLADDCPSTAAGDKSAFPLYQKYAQSDRVCHLQPEYNNTLLLFKTGNADTWQNVTLGNALNGLEKWQGKPALIYNSKNGENLNSYSCPGGKVYVGCLDNGVDGLPWIFLSSGEQCSESLLSLVHGNGTSEYRGSRDFSWQAYNYECWCQWMDNPCPIANITINAEDVNPNVTLTYSTETPNNPTTHNLTVNTANPFIATFRLEATHTWDSGGQSSNHDPNEKSIQTVTVEVCKSSGMTAFTSTSPPRFFRAEPYENLGQKQLARGEFATFSNGDWPLLEGNCAPTLYIFSKPTADIPDPDRVLQVAPDGYSLLWNTTEKVKDGGKDANNWKICVKSVGFADACHPLRLEVCGYEEYMIDSAKENDVVAGELVVNYQYPWIPITSDYIEDPWLKGSQENLTYVQSEFSHSLYSFEHFFSIAQGGCFKWEWLRLENEDGTLNSDNAYSINEEADSDGKDLGNLRIMYNATKDESIWIKPVSPWMADPSKTVRMKVNVKSCDFITNVNEYDAPVTYNFNVEDGNRDVYVLQQWVNGIHMNHPCNVDRANSGHWRLEFFTNEENDEYLATGDEKVFAADTDLGALKITWKSTKRESVGTFNFLARLTYCGSQEGYCYHVQRQQVTVIGTYYRDRHYVIPGCEPHCLSVNDFKELHRAYRSGGDCFATRKSETTNFRQSPWDDKMKACPNFCADMNNFSFENKGASKISLVLDQNQLPHTIDLKDFVGVGGAGAVTKVAFKTGNDDLDTDNDLIGMFAFNYDTLEFTITGQNVEEFENYAFKALFYGCAQGTGERDVYNSYNNDLVQLEIEFANITISDCVGQQLTANPDPYEVNVQKNSGTAVKIFDPDDKYDIFSISEEDRCYIQKIMMYDGEEKIEGNQALAYRFNAGNNYNEDGGDIVMNTIFTPVNGEIQQIIEFTVKAQTHGNPFHTASGTVRVKLGCFAESSLSASFISNPLFDDTVQYLGTIPQAFLIRMVGGGTGSKTYPLNELISWTSDIAGCGAQEVGLYTKDYSDLATPTGFGIVQNPNTADLITGLIDPQLTVDLTKKIIKTMYFRGKTGADATSRQSADIQGRLALCGNEQIWWTESNSDLYTFSSDGTQTPNSKETFDLSDDFYYQYYLDTTDSFNSFAGEVFPECPIVNYTLCGDNACNSDASAFPGWTISGTTLSIDINVPVKEGTLWVRSTTFGGVTLIKEIKTNICGYEILTAPANPFDVLYEVIADRNGAKISYGQWFQNDEDNNCPTDTYYLKKNSQGTEDLGVLNGMLAVNEQNFEIEYRVTETGNFTVYMFAESVSGKRVSREVNIRVEFYMDTLFIYPEHNNPPYSIFTADRNLRPKKQYKVVDNNEYFCWTPIEGKVVPASALNEWEGDFLVMTNCADICVRPTQSIFTPDYPTTPAIEVKMDVADLDYTLNWADHLYTTDQAHDQVVHERVVPAEEMADKFINAVQSMIMFNQENVNGALVTDNQYIEMEGKLFFWEAWGCAKPAVPATFAEDNLDLYFSRKVLNLTIYDCVGQIYTAVEGEDDDYPVKLEIQKNKGIQTLMTNAEKYAYFDVDDDERCAIQKVSLWGRAETGEEWQLITSGNEGNFYQDALMRKFQVNSYDEELGAVQVDTDVPTDNIQYHFFVRLKAEGYDPTVFAWSYIEAIVGCFEETSISVAPREELPGNITLYNQNGAILKMYFTKGSPIAGPVLSFLEFTTDIPHCFASKIYFYKNDGSTPLREADGVFLVDDATGNVANYTVKNWNGFMNDAIFEASRTVPFYDQIVIKGTTWDESQSVEARIHVTICGNEQVNNNFEVHEVYNISYHDGTPGNENWVSYDITGMYDTSSNILPLNECPITQVTICADANCNDLVPSNQARMVGLTQLEVNLGVPVVHGTSYYLTPSSISGNDRKDEIIVKICGYERFTRDDDGPYYNIYEIFRGPQTSDMNTFIQNDNATECPHTWHLSSDNDTIIPLEDLMADMFEIDTITGIMTYHPSIDGNFTFWVHAKTLAGIQISKEVKIQAEFWMDQLLEIPRCYHEGNQYCTKDRLDFLYPFKAYTLTDEGPEDFCIMTKSSEYVSYPPNEGQVSYEGIMIMQDCSPICLAGQDFDHEFEADMLQVHKDFTELPYNIPVGNTIAVLGEMDLSHMNLVSDKMFLRDILRPHIEGTLLEVIPEGATEFEGEQITLDYWGCSTPADAVDGTVGNNTFAESNLDLKRKTRISVNLTLYNCSDQEILIKYEGREGLNGPEPFFEVYNYDGLSIDFNLQFQKNRDFVQMLTRNQTVELFDVKYDEFCPIRKYQLYEYWNGKPKIEGNNFFVPRFDAHNYIEDGNIMINTNIQTGDETLDFETMEYYYWYWEYYDYDPATEKEFLISLRPEAYFNVKKDLRVYIRLGCFAESSYDAPVMRIEMPDEDWPYVMPSNNTDDGSLFKIYLTRDDNIEYVNLRKLILWQSNIPLCTATVITLLDESDNVYFRRNPTFKSNWTHIAGTVEPILKIDRSVPEYKTITIKGENWYRTAYTTTQLTIAVCGDEIVTEKKPRNIWEIGTLWNETILNYTLTDFFETQSEILPLDECPVIAYEIYEVYNQTVVAPPNFQIVGDYLFLNISVPVKETIYYLKGITSSPNFAIYNITVQVCGYEILNATTELDLKKGYHTHNIYQDVTIGTYRINLHDFFVNDDEERCPVFAFELYMDQNGTIPVLEDAQMNSRFRVDNISLVLMPKVGTFTFWVFARSEARVNASIEWTVEWFQPLDDPYYWTPINVTNSPPEFSVDMKDKVYPLESQWQTYNEILAEGAALNEANSTNATALNLQRQALEDKIETLEISFALPPTEDFDGDLPIKLNVTFEPELDCMIFFDGSVYFDYNLFYAGNYQGADTEFKFVTTALLTDSAGTQNTYKFDIVVAPKGTYVPVETAATNSTTEEKTDETVEEQPTGDNTTEPSTETPSGPAQPPSVPNVVIDATELNNVKRPPRQNQPVVVMTYNNPVERFEKVEPTLNKIAIDKAGVLGLDFSNDMVFPENWVEMHAKYLESTEQKDKAAVARRRLSGSAQPFLRTYLRNPITGQEVEIANDGIDIITLEPNRIESQIKFKNPEEVSQSSQSMPDQLVVRFDKNLVLNDVNGNSLVFDSGVDSDTSIDFAIPIQPQMDKSSSSIKTLKATGVAVQVVGTITTFVQLLVSWMTKASLTNFWCMINSQQNLAFLPMLTVNIPSPVSYYMEFLVKFSTFDPIPVQSFFKFMNFEWTLSPSTRQTLQRIGISDKIFVDVIGSLFMFALIFGAVQIVAIFLGCCQNNKYVKKAHDHLSSDTSLQTVVVVFFLELYIDLLVGGFVNTENFWLFEESSNWGPNGNLPGGDQFTIILGTIFYFAAIIFPFVVLYLLHRKSRDQFQPKGLQMQYDMWYGVLYRDFKTNTNGVFHYFFVFLMRRVAFVYIAYYYHKPENTTFQIFANIYISFLFMLYLIQFKPYIDKDVNFLQILNEGIYLLISYNLFAFTDFNQDVSSKSIFGWVMVILSIFNFCYPNLYLVLTTLWPDIKRAFFTKKVAEDPKVRMAREFFEDRRQRLVYHYQMNLKNKVADDVNHPVPPMKKNQVLPEETYEDIINKNTFEQRGLKAEGARQVKGLSDLLKGPTVDWKRDIELEAVPEKTEIDISTGN